MADSSRYDLDVKANFEGEYLLTGEFIHISNDPFTACRDAVKKVTFKVVIHLNCDDVGITEPYGQLMFTISPPSTADEMPAGGSFQSDALFYWIRTSVSHQFHGMFINQHPYSCTLE